MKRIVLLALAATALSCNGVSADVGNDAFMRVSGARFVRGAFPASSPEGPAVEAVTLVGTSIWPGMQSDPIGGTLGAGATAAAIGLRGDVGYWIVGAGVPSVATPTEPSFDTSASFSLGIVPGTYTLLVAAVDDSGRFGAPSAQILTEVPSPLNPPATGALVVTLTWDTEANLSLHVVDPGGVELYWGNQSTEPPFTLPFTDAGSIGTIDYDSNANCVIDGLRREDAVWKSAPPAGKYTVRVDAPSLCGQPDASWKVKVTLDGNEIAEAGGLALDADTMGAHGVGSGVLAVEFSVP